MYHFGDLAGPGPDFTDFRFNHWKPIIFELWQAVAQILFVFIEILLEI